MANGASGLNQSAEGHAQTWSTTSLVPVPIPSQDLEESTAQETISGQNLAQSASRIH